METQFSIGTVTTIDASPQLLSIYYSPYPLSVLVMEAQVFARDTVSGDSCGWRLSAAFKTDDLGVFTQISTTGESYVAKDTSLSAAAIDIVTFSDHIDFNVTGLAGKTIFWGVSAKFSICQYLP